MTADPVDAFFAALWEGYVAITPQARRVHALLEARGETIVNDHVAFRTWDRGPVRLDRLLAPLRAWGYVETGRYDFPAKRLAAVSISHPSGRHPRVFLSELLADRFSPALLATVEALVAQVPADAAPLDLLLDRHRWAPVSAATYEALAAESEYAGWLAAFGLVANHFTVSVNALATFDGLAAVNAFLEAEGFALNRAGGVIKGGPEERLAQSSTLADEVPWTFAGGEVRTIPSCYYELALRYPDPATGRLYDGFVTASADRIFESTDRR